MPDEKPIDNIPPVIIRALKQYRKEHCFDDSEYGIAIDKFLAARMVRSLQSGKTQKVKRG